LAGIYIHIPFCERKCSYCDFYSIEDHSYQKKFILALDKEIELYSSKFRNESIETIYLGGGTPSVLSAKSIEHIISIVRNRFAVSYHPEITMEVNPGTISVESLKDFHSAGINRLSIGVQSLHDEDLKFLTRIHTASEAMNAIESAHKAGFRNFGVDLIFGLPTQSLKTWSDILNKVVQISPEHISAYSLIVEDRTPLFHLVDSGNIILPPEELVADMFVMTMDILENVGYQHYEVSNYSHPGKESRHNKNYWMHLPYLGVGPSAHSFQDNNRWWNVRNIEKYIKMLENGVAPVEDLEHLNSNQLLTETVMFGLRMGKLDMVEIQRRFGLDIEPGTDNLISELVGELFIENSNGILKLTNRGFVFCDEISKRILGTMKFR
jgi:oxygen-independent coproporphyrinogen III oxidase